MKKVIEIEKAIEEFIKYTKNFDLSNNRIKGKQEHSLRVMRISEEIAKRLNWKKEEIEIATLIGLLHDIGRFEQYQEFKTFHDSRSVDHGDLGVKILQKDNTIRKYLKDKKYDEIILTSIEQHNKYKLKDVLPKETEKYCKLIKDADKIDILYESIIMFWQGEEEEIENGIITQRVFEEFMNENLVKHEIKKEKIDEVVGFLSYVFDIFYKESLEILKEKKYFNDLIMKFNWKQEKTKEDMKKIEEKINEKLNNKQ